jgi:phage terminase Nu1 subunit (DNA packaging protein)
MTDEQAARPYELVTRAELAEIMRCSVPTIDRMRRAGMPHVTWGRRLVRFRVVDAIGWAEQQQRQTDGEA